MQNKIIHSFKLIQKADVAIAHQSKEYDTEAMLKYVSFNSICCLKGWFVGIVYEKPFNSNSLTYVVYYILYAKVSLEDAWIQMAPLGVVI